MPEDLEHTVIHYERLLREKKPVEAYQLLTLGYRNLHVKYTNLELWGYADRRILLEVIMQDNLPRHYKLSFEYRLPENCRSEVGALAEAYKNKAEHWSINPNN